MAMMLRSAKQVMKAMHGAQYQAIPAQQPDIGEMRVKASPGYPLAPPRRKELLVASAGFGQLESRPDFARGGQRE
jgi:hypothetical protein